MTGLAFDEQAMLAAIEANARAVTSLDELASRLAPTYRIAVRFGDRACGGPYLLHLRCGGPDELEARLRLAADLGVETAPGVAAVVPTRDGQEIVVQRYPVLDGDELVWATSAAVELDAAGAATLRADTRKLAAASWFHPTVRHDELWLVGARSGRPFVADWHLVQKARGKHALEEFVEYVDGELERWGFRLQLRLRNEVRRRLVTTFGAPKVLLPVVHPVSREAALASVRTAVEAGCRGVFLIDQGMDEAAVLQLVLEVRRDHPALWVGVNLLGRAPVDALACALDACEGRIDGLWSDHADFVPDRKKVAMYAYLEARAARRWHGLFFGGVAFKYQAPVARDDLEKVAAEGRSMMDVVTTSGPGTGQAADVDKLARMRRGVGDDGALALASGVTADNVADYLPHVDVFLVGTGLERSFGVFDPERVARLQAAIAAAR